jgi:hypothetical protein
VSLRGSRCCMLNTEMYLVNSAGHVETLIHGVLGIYINLIYIINNTPLKGHKVRAFACLNIKNYI